MKLSEIPKESEQWKYRLQTMREKSIAEINFSDALDVVITREEYRTLSDDKQRELIQAWLYPTNDDEIQDEIHFAEMKKFFNDELENICFKSHLTFCSACGADERVAYIGIIRTDSGALLNFSFCVDCRDELTLKKNAEIATQERIGA